MTLTQWITAIRRRASIVSAAAALAAISLSPSTSFADEPLVTRIGRFQIPFDVEAEPGQTVDGFAVLYGSQDGGANWEQLQSVPAAQGKFTFNAPRDGRYSFAIRVADAQGNLPPSSAMQGAQPEMEVIVDTVSPDLKLELFDSSPGQVIVSWTCTDVTADPNTLAIEYSDAADGRWKAIQLQPAVNGQAIIAAASGRAISVRAQITDAAGNRGEATAQVVSRSNSTTSPGTVPGAGAGQVKSGMPLGANPFGASQKPGTTSGPMTYPKVMPSNSVASVPPSSTANGDPNRTPAMQTAASYPMSNGVATSNPATGNAQSQVVNGAIFDLDYSVEDVGPSGVSAVELFVTEDGGQSWFKYGVDADLKSPFTVDTRGEGTFGFAVRVRNGLGFTDTPPQPGQAPEIVVTVDSSAPVIEFAQPTVKADGFATIQLQWRVSDQNPSTTPVRLEYSASPAGPWTPVFDWQVDQSSFQWAVRPGTPASVYFRLLARDNAGNVSSAATPQAVMVDMKKPVGRLLRVQTVSQPAGSTYYGQ